MPTHLVDRRAPHGRVGYSSRAKAGIDMRRVVINCCRIICSALAVLTALSTAIVQAAVERPNIILVMADDLGWGDVAYHGVDKTIQTPCLDEMSKAGIRFDRFYSQAAICSPTRASCLTGRHPARYRMLLGTPLRTQEVTLAEVLHAVGYATGHFGKWHMGRVNERRGPHEHGFDEWFSTPNNTIKIDPDTYFHNGKAMGVIEGEDNQIIMDRALSFIRQQTEAKKPLLAVIWFHTPHDPIGTTQEFLDLYDEKLGFRRKRYGEISAMDRQIGRLRIELRTMKIADNTLLWFCSDNGWRTEGLRKGKTSLYEGGVKVAGILEWPARIRKPFQTDIPCCTIDFYPTILDLLGLKVENQPLLDGVSLVELIDGKMIKRPRFLAFGATFSPHQCLVDGRFKLHILKDETVELYNISADLGESQNVADQHPEVVKQMHDHLKKWSASVEASVEKRDYVEGPLKVTAMDDLRIERSSTAEPR